MSAATLEQAPPRRHRLLVLALLAPVLVFFIVWNTIPTLWLMGLSFYRFSLTSGRPPIPYGLGNYANLLADTGIWLDLSRTFRFMAVTVTIETLLGVALGLLFWGSARLPGRRLALTLLFAPMVVTPVASGTFFRLIYDPTFGVLNAILRGLGFGTLDFLGDSALAFSAVVAVDVWMWTPFMILMTLAALASVPKAELEAAEVDGLPWTQRMRLIVLHHGRYILMLGILLRAIDSFKTMDLIYNMTFGGPGEATQLVAVTLYRRAFEAFNMGSSSALAIVLLLVSIGLTSTFVYLLRQRERAQS